MKSGSPEELFQLQAVDEKRKKTVLKNFFFSLFMSLFIEIDVAKKRNENIRFS